MKAASDLVLILEDEHGDLYVQVIDAKTTGAINGFNGKPTLKPRASLATNLRKSLDTHPILSDPEKRLLENHRLQLILYQEALKRMRKTISKNRASFQKSSDLFGCKWAFTHIE